MFKETEIRERGFTLVELLVLGAVAGLVSVVHECIASPLLGKPLGSGLKDPDFVRETIGMLIGPAIFGYGVARPFRAKMDHAVLLVQSFGILLGLAGGGATVVSWLDGSFGE